MCIDFVCYTEGRTIFSEILRHQLLLKDFTFTWIQCTCSTSHREYSLEYFGTESCRNISFSQVLSAYIIPKATILRNISAPPAANILGNISAPTAAEIFHFTQIQCTYSPSQNLEYLGAENCRNISFSRVLSLHIIPQGKPIFSEIFRHQQLSKDSF